MRGMTKVAEEAIQGIDEPKLAFRDPDHAAALPPCGPNAPAETWGSSETRPSLQPYSIVVQGELILLLTATSRTIDR
jgi:hypothetical protein